MKTYFNWKQKEIKWGHATTVPALQENHNSKQSCWVDTEYLAADEGKIRRQAMFLTAFTDTEVFLKFIPLSSQT